MSQLRLNLAEGSIAFDCTESNARALQAALHELMDRLKALAVAPAGASRTKSEPLPCLDYKQPGDLRIEVFCNPNIWPTPYAAKILLTLKNESMRLSTEADLSRMLEDLSQYLEQY